MKKEETSLQLLKKFIPSGTFDLVIPYFNSCSIHLTITRERKSILGDYRHPTPKNPVHRISVNANLNPYSFLITLLHEIAHLQVFIHFKNAVPPHGKEWKTQFRHILIPFIGRGFFPKDVEKALIVYLKNPAASTCTDPGLYKALYRYDEKKPDRRLIDEMEAGQFFETQDGRIFEILEKLRTRSKCRETANGKMYLFPGIIEVKQIRYDKKRTA